MCTRRTHAYAFLIVVSLAASVSADVWTKAYEAPSVGTIPIPNAALRQDGSLLFVYTLESGELCVVDAGRDGSARSLRCYTEKAPYTPGVAPAKDGGWFLFGSRYDDRKVESAWVVRADRTGAVVWSRIYSGPEHIRVTDAEQTKDGGLVLVGSIGRLHDKPYFDSAKAFMMKTSRDGSIDWQRTLDTSGVEELKDVVVASDGIVAGGWTGFGAVVIKVDDRGDTRWQSLFGGVRVEALALAGSNEIFASGMTVDFRREGTYWLARIDRNGRQVWQRASPSTAGSLRNVTIQPGGDLVVHTVPVTEQDGYFLAAFTPAGELRWQRHIKLGRGRIRAAAGPTTDGGLVLLSSASKTVEIHKLDRSGRGSPCIEAGGRVPSIAFAVLNKPPFEQPVEPGLSSVVAEAKVIVARSETLSRGTECVPAAAAVAASEAIRTAPPSPAVETMERLTNRNMQGEADMRALLIAREFATLDRLAEEFQRTRSERFDGYLNLSAFFDALSHARGFPSEKTHIELMEAWRKSAPRSAAAAIATARTYEAYASNARGGGFAHTVTDPAWQKSEALRNRGLTVLREAESFAAPNPEYYVALIPLVSCEEAKRLGYDPKLGKLAYPLIFRKAAWYMLPRWCGSAEEYRKFAEYAADRTRAEDGDYLYARLAWDAMRVEKSPDFAQFGFDWRRIRQGFLDVIAKYPDWATYHHRLAWSAWLMGDRGTAREMFLLPQLGWSDPISTVWGRRQNYETARSWALQGPAEPPFGVTGSQQPPASGTSLKPVDRSGWVATVASEWPPIVMRNVIRLSDGSVLREFNSFLLETPGGVVAVTALTDPQLITLHEYTKMPLLRLDLLRTKLASWTMFAPSAPSRTLKASAFKFMTEAALPVKRGVVVTLAPVNGPLPVTPLKGSAVPKFGTRLYVVGCVAGRTPCQQTAYSAKAHAGMTAAPDVITFGLGFEDDVEWSEFIGSPVIDEEGRAIGVVTAEYWVPVPDSKRNRATGEGLGILLKPAP